MTKSIWIFAGLVFTAAMGCGTSPIPLDPPPTLPQLPQIRASTGVAVFDIVPAGLTDVLDVVLTNGGQDDLILSTVEITGDTASVFSITATTPSDSTAPNDSTAPSQSGIALSITFAPAARGFYAANLHIVSNAEDFPDLTLELMGAAGQDDPTTTGIIDLSLQPDLLVLETTTTVVSDIGMAFVRMANVGQRSLAIGGYTLNPLASVGPYRFPQELAANLPTVDVPFGLGGRGYLVLPVLYEPDSGDAGPHQVDVTVTTYDYDDVVFDSSTCTLGEPGCPVRSVPTGALTDTVVGVNSQ